MQASSHVFHRQGCMFSPKQNGPGSKSLIQSHGMPSNQDANLAKNINNKNRWVYYRNITTSKYHSITLFRKKKHGRVFTKQIFGPTIQLSLLMFLFPLDCWKSSKGVSSVTEAVERCGFWFFWSKESWRTWVFFFLRNRCNCRNVSFFGDTVDGRSPAPSWYGE